MKELKSVPMSARTCFVHKVFRSWGSEAVRFRKLELLGCARQKARRPVGAMYCPLVIHGEGGADNLMV